MTARGPSVPLRRTGINPEDAKRVEEMRADEAKYGKKWNADSSDARFLLRLVEKLRKEVESLRDEKRLVQKETIYSIFRVLILRARREAGMTQADVAKAVGVALRTVQAWEAGSACPRAENLRAVGEVLRIQWWDCAASRPSEDGGVLLESDGP